MKNFKTKVEFLVKYCRYPYLLEYFKEKLLFFLTKKSSRLSITLRFQGILILTSKNAKDSTYIFDS